jgi:CelD/BcsL family acetyltransferase involved in cellulose biosynthesis
MGPHGRSNGGVAGSVGGDVGAPWDGYDAAPLAVRVALLVRAVEWATAPLYDLAGLLDDFDAAQLATLARHGAPFAGRADAGAAAGCPPPHA